MSAPERPPTDPLDIELDATLRDYPLRPTPPGLARGVLARVRALPSRPRFRLSWLDLALPAFGGVLAGVLFLLGALAATPQTLARAQSTLGVLLGSGGPQNAVLLLIAVPVAVLVAGALLLVAGVALLSGRR